MSKDAEKRTPAYVAFKTFLTAVETLEGGVPKQIDRKIWRTFSGLIQSQVMGAFRFLGLVDGQEPTADLRKLVEDKENRPAVLREILKKSYSNLNFHELRRMTGTMLEGLIEKLGVTGGTKRKAVTFFLQATKYADVPLSRFLLERTRNSPVRRKKRAVPGEVVVNDGTPVRHPANDGRTKTIELQNGVRLSLWVSADLIAIVAEDRKFVLSLVEKLEEYEATRNGKRD